MAELTVYLWRDGLRVARCKARYAGGSHLFIHADPLLYKKGQTITLEFPVARPDGVEQAACAAQVLRRTPDGFDVRLRVISKAQLTGSDVRYPGDAPAEVSSEGSEPVGPVVHGGRAETFWEEPG